MKRSVAALIGFVLAALALVAGPAWAASATAATPYCGIQWGSLEKGVTTGTVGPEVGTLTDLRAGRHACYDRLVLDVQGRSAGYTVRYVPELVQGGSGHVVHVDGGARLEIVADLLATDAGGNRLYDPADPGHAVDVSGFGTFRQVASLGNVEAREVVGLGVRARLPFRVFELDGPGSGSRLVVDVAHRWS
ncbi:AMIN-like domain-containing (lipo)protein [Cellulomonas aerilata]|uniref:AMIN-like domain-containing protein n=1 Tax=Cellulomonas aerilata TaxID=515326 RepID=A0A512DH97_9CELL|nr:hypothetical protein [Cellulomonas aerilata]GEO35847.1 hypothetical protein CAE01nite_35720 [Cellulomonas aerilata]